MDISILSATAKQMVAPGKGLIAADESTPSCKKRFDAVGIECTEETRRQYRGLIISAPGLEQYVSGVILYDETIRQKDDSGEPFAEVLQSKGILPGIKVDAGAKDLALHPDEKVTEGLDGLRERLAEYAAMGAKFAKWRAVITIGQNIPSAACIRANAHALARYAALCQEADIVPMIEPEVLIDGDHTIEQCRDATAATLKDVFAELAVQGVALEGLILKSSMVIAGKESAKQSSAQEVAEQTLAVLRENAPSNLAGVVFLSGGQGDEQATENLDAMNRSTSFDKAQDKPLTASKLPWPLTFSYSRAIQNSVLKIWAADMSGNVAKAQEALLFRAKMNSLAAQGQYSAELEKERPY